MRNKKSVAWDRDTEILKRLQSVAAMMVRGAGSLDIQAALNSDVTPYALITAKRDMQRVRELWRKEAEKTIADSRAQSIANLVEIKMQAWDQFNKSKAARWLRVLLDAEKQIGELQGTKITQQDYNFNLDLLQCTDEQLERISRGEDPLTVLLTGRGSSGATPATRGRNHAGDALV
jgi:hypothetical protein